MKAASRGGSPLGSGSLKRREMTKQSDLIVPILIPFFAQDKYTKKALMRWRDTEGFATARLAAEESGYKVLGIKFDKWRGNGLTGYIYVAFKVKVEEREMGEIILSQNIKCPECGSSELIHGGTLVPYGYRCWNCLTEFEDHTPFPEALVGREYTELAYNLIKRKGKAIKATRAEKAKYIMERDDQTRRDKGRAGRTGT